MSSITGGPQCCSSSCSAVTWQVAFPALLRCGSAPKVQGDWRPHFLRAAPQARLLAAHKELTHGETEGMTPGAYRQRVQIFSPITSVTDARAR
jgi:hypothetical protein